VGAEIAISGPLEFRRVQSRPLAFFVGFFFSFRLCIVLIAVRVPGAEPSTGSAVSIGLDFLLFGLVCFNALGAGQRTLAAILRMPAIRWVLVFLAFSCLSLAWSETASLPDSIAYWLGLALDVASVVLLLRRGTGTDEAHAVLRGFIWSTCLLAVIAWIMPAPPDLRLGDEQFFNTNEIGNLCAFAVFFAQYLTRSSDGQWRFAKVFLVITLIRSLSKATLAAFVVSELFLLILDRSMSRKTRVLLMGSALLLILVFWGLFEAYYDVYTTAGNQAETLTGRTAIWLYAANATFDHTWTPWIGHGFDSWWKVVPPFGNEMFEARHAENEVLQQFYAYGAVGVLILTGIYSSLLRQVRRITVPAIKVPLLCVLIFVFVRGLAEADAFDLLLPLWSIVLISALAHDGSAANGQVPVGLSIGKQVLDA
jgi:hypothetical protein